jgi:hypothetical protein
VARALGDVPKVSEAFRLGEISYSKVRAMTRVANADNEDSLLMIAKHGTARHVETLVSGYRQAKRLNEEGIAGQQQRSREFNYHWDDDGSLVFSGRLPAEVGAVLMQALKSAVDRAEEEAEVTAETSSQGSRKGSRTGTFTQKPFSRSGKANRWTVTWPSECYGT